MATATKCATCYGTIVELALCKLHPMCVRHVYHDSCTPRTDCSYCATVSAFVTCDIRAANNSCFCTHFHAAAECINTHVSKTVADILLAVNEVSIDTIISKHLTTRARNTVWIKYIHSLIAAGVADHPHIVPVKPGVVVTAAVLQYRELQKMLPRDGVWHSCSHLHQDTVKWIRATRPVDVVLAPNDAYIRKRTPLGIDSPTALKTLLGEVYPNGIHMLHLYAEHDQMAAWLRQLQQELVFIEGADGGFVIFRKEKRQIDTIGYRIAQSVGEPCAILFDCVRDQNQFDSNIMPQIHAGVRAAIIQDLLALRYVKVVGTYVIAYGMLLGVNKEVLAQEFPTEVLCETERQTVVNMTNHNLQQRRRRKRAQNTNKYKKKKR